MIYRSILLVFLAGCVQDSRETSGELPAYLGGAFLASGADSFDSSEMINFLDLLERPYLATLSKSFGESTTRWALYTHAVKDRPHVFQQYLYNGPCHRLGNCFEHELLPKLSAEELNEALCRGEHETDVKKHLLGALANCQNVANENTLCLLALGLESDNEECAVLQLAEWAIQSGWQQEELVHNPENSNSYLGLGGANYLEFHGLRVPEEAFNTAGGNVITTLDGVRPDFCNEDRGSVGARVTTDEVREWFRLYSSRAFALGFWCPEWQGLHTNESRRVDPRARSFGLLRSDFDSIFSIIGDDNG